MMQITKNHHYPARGDGLQSIIREDGLPYVVTLFGGEYPLCHWLQVIGQHKLSTEDYRAVCQAMRKTFDEIVQR